MYIWMRLIFLVFGVVYAGAAFGSGLDYVNEDHPLAEMAASSESNDLCSKLIRSRNLQSFEGLSGNIDGSDFDLIYKHLRSEEQRGIASFAMIRDGVDDDRLMWFFNAIFLAVNVCGKSSRGLDGYIFINEVNISLRGSSKNYNPSELNDGELYILKSLADAHDRIKVSSIK